MYYKGQPKVNPLKLLPKDFLKNEVRKAIPDTKLDDGEKYVIKSIFGLNGYKVTSRETLASLYNLSVGEMIVWENKVLAKVVGNIH